jgi:hypothetical protein
VLLGLAATVTVLGFFAVDTLRNAPETFTAIVAITFLAVVLDLVWKRVRARSLGVVTEEAAAPAVPE